MKTKPKKTLTRKSNIKLASRGKRKEGISTYYKRVRGKRDRRNMLAILLGSSFLVASLVLLKKGYKFLSFVTLVGAVTSFCSLTTWNFTYIPAALSITASLLSSFAEMAAFYSKPTSI